MAGLVGAGRTELLRALFGIDARARRQRFALRASRLRLRQPRDAIRAGLALVPEDRKQQGVILEMAVRENIEPRQPAPRPARAAFLNRRREDELRARDDRASCASRRRSDRQLVQFLSGGNQQKVVLGKWLALKPRVLLLDEPTRGIDVGAKQEIYRLMEELAAEGVAILFVSSEMEEILRMSDRALVMHEGRITGELAARRALARKRDALATGSGT